MNSKLLLFLAGSLLALPQNYNEIFAISNVLTSVESKLTRRAYANEHNSPIEEHRREYPWPEEVQANIEDIVLDEFDLEAGIDYKITNVNTEWNNIIWLSPQNRTSDPKAMLDFAEHISFAKDGFARTPFTLQYT